VNSTTLLHLKLTYLTLLYLCITFYTINCGTPIVIFMFIAEYCMAQRDPVCNMMVDEKKAQHVSEVNGQKVYLCSAQCKSQFDQNPSGYGY
jgi:YHS domain-containing protein